jgi:hypothetical protein
MSLFLPMICPELHVSQVSKADIQAIENQLSEQLLHDYQQAPDWLLRLLYNGHYLHKQNGPAASHSLFTCGHSSWNRSAGIMRIYIPTHLLDSDGLELDIIAKLVGLHLTRLD